MKKMIFSAIALTAFSFAGMANEVKENKNDVKTFKISEQNLTTKGVDCFELAVNTITAIETITQTELSESLTQMVLNNVMAKCWKDNGNSFN